nr:NF-kappa-B inhibitor delta isoform X11 [Symphalangus syndactylus]
MEAGPWRVSALPSGPPQFPAVVPGPSLEAARAHMLALGPQQLLAQDEEGDTLLHLFAARGLRWAAYAAAEMLQVYRRLDIREHKGKTPLLVAAAANQPLIVEDLLNLGAEPNAADHQGRSVLHVAATYGLPGVLLAVLNSGVQVDLEARDFEGLTPLHTAVLALNVAMRPSDLCPRVLSTQARDRLDCVHMLLQMGANHTSQRQGLALSPRLECRGAITNHCSLDFLTSSIPPTSASQVAGTTGTSHLTQLIVLYFS